MTDVVQHVQGDVRSVDIRAIKRIPGIPNRDLNKETIASLRVCVQTIEDIRKIPLIHVVPGSHFGLSDEHYGLLSGFHRMQVYEEVYLFHHCDELGYSDYISECMNNHIWQLDKMTKLPALSIPVILRTDVRTREDVILARWEDNRTHGTPPTSKERREHALYLAEVYQYGVKGIPSRITQREIALMCGLEESTVSKLLKRHAEEESEEDREPEQRDYERRMQTSTDALIAKMHTFYQQEKAFFSSGTSEKDLAHRARLIARGMTRRGYSAQEAYQVGLAFLSAYEEMSGQKIVTRHQ